MDSSENGQTIIDAWGIVTPSEVISALNDLKALENSLNVLPEKSRADAGIQSIYPMTPAMSTGQVAKREYNVTIPSDRATSVSQRWDPGYYGSVQGYIYGKAIFPAYWNKIRGYILNKTKTFTVIATFDDGSSINFEYKDELGLLTTAFQKVDSTAQKNGKGYKPNSNPKYYNSPETLDINQSGAFVYTSTKTCDNYTITSSDGGRWTGVICIYVYTS